MNTTKFYTILSFIFINHLTYAWTVSARGDLNYSKTDNVNSSVSNLQSDSYKSYYFHVQTKDDTDRIRFKLKGDRYTNTTSNNNNTFDLSWQIKTSKQREHNLSYYQQRYQSDPTIDSYTSSNNRGFKYSTTYTKEFSNEKLAYFTFSFNYKNYYQQIDRKDRSIDLSGGYENVLNQDLTFSADLSLGFVSSTDSAYTNYNLGPSLSFNYNIGENVESYLSSSLVYTAYSNQTFQTRVRNRTVTNKEQQTLFTTEAGVILNFIENVPLTVKYQINKNSSNNPESAYKSHIFVFNASLKI